MLRWVHINSYFISNWYPHNFENDEHIKIQNNHIFIKSHTLLRVYTSVFFLFQLLKIHVTVHCNTRDGSSRKLLESRATRVIGCRVGSSRVILGFDFRANRVNNRVKNQLFRVKIELEKKIFWVKIELGKFFSVSNQVQFFNFLLWIFENAYLICSINKYA